MINNLKILAIIPARGGSQRLPRKNIRLLAGKPLITHAISAVLGSSFIDRVIVSTDDMEIAEIAKEHGAEVPFLRPAVLASHTASPFDVVLHALQEIEKDNTKYDLIVLIQPTSPLVQTGDIEEALKKIVQSESNSCVSVCEISERPEWMFSIETDRANPFSDLHNTEARSQDLPKIYRLNGAVYVTRREVILEHKKLVDHKNLSAIVMPRGRSIDIDEAIDFEIAEVLLSKPVRSIKTEFNNRGIFIIAEAGVNHNGQLKIAKKLVDAAKKAGVDAVKFQTFRSESLVSSKAPKAKYQKEASGDSQLEMLKRLELSENDFIELKNYCDRKKIVFLSTPFDPESADFLDKLDIPAFKIGSGDLTNLQLIKQIAKYGKPIILSTGMSTMAEIERAVKEIESTKNINLILLHCTSNYPASHDTVNLSAMETLRKKFGLTIGYSDHTIGLEVSIAAVAMGAKVIEKHFTLDKEMDGPDHKASIEPQELAHLVKAIRNIEKAFGDGEKKPLPSEHNIRQVARKSICASCDIKKGQKLSADMLVIKRPEGGIKPELFDSIIDRKSIRTIKKDDLIHLEDLE